MKKLSLPTLRDRRQPTSYCAYCPKLCRHTCPVSTAQSRETTTPWGKMTIAHRSSLGELPPHRSYTETAYACTGCLRCTTACDHDNDVAEVLTIARQDGGLHPALAPNIEALRERHFRRERTAAAIGQTLQTRAENHPSGHVLFVGCTSLVSGLEDARAHTRAHATVGGTNATCSASICCGLPLLEAGDLTGFVDAAKQFWRKHAKAETIVFNDPGCQHALLRRGPAFGVPVPTKQKHLSLLTFFDEHAARVSALPNAPAMYFKDPCRLGRGLGVYQAPRRLIARLTGHKALEFDYAFDDASCSGAGGQLPVTAPETAAAIAQETVAPAGTKWVATACAASKKQLAAAGANCVDLGALVASSIAPNGEKLPWRV